MLSVLLIIISIYYCVWRMQNEREMKEGNDAKEANMEKREEDGGGFLVLSG